MQSSLPNDPQRLRPRKNPIQARSGATVETIYEATIQVLMVDDLARLTTTRVAERAGVSVGTLYQYFPNKEALLFAILQRHFEEMADAIENVSSNSDLRPLADLAERLADAYLSVKIARPEATSALYRAAGAIDQFRLPASIYRRLENAVVNVLQNASDASFEDYGRSASTLLAALAGVSRGGFGKLDPGTDMLDRLVEESRLLSRAYLRAAANGHSTSLETSGIRSHDSR